MTAQDIKNELAAVGVCWTHDGRLVDQAASGANELAVNMATAVALAAAATAAGLSSADVAALARSFLDGDTVGWLAFVSGTL